ncbi:PREDICTED: uncharacterized protein LOC109180738 [Ipomoea nil]|uniref:uncharacterized protein LOC109180738 n=1 Tax=Ipomoea nil TaxID=35883 RepID=UPI0009009B12|nr:PREDICTED: uncharacterized protein LOC109180738 [Ipomoea nil]
MNILSWNCRGLGGTRTVRELLGVSSKERPFFVFLTETKAKADKIEEVRVKLGFEGAVSVDCVGRGGGLAMFWRDAEAASFLSYSVNHIDIEVKQPGKPMWRLTGFYGEPDRSRRHITWESLRQLKGRSSLPWVVVGDFNDITCLSEKRGTHSHPEALMDGFNDALNECNLVDMGMSGGQFTWSKGHGTEAWVEERLDRAVATVEWLELHEDTEVRKVYTSQSDHSAILVDMEQRPIRHARRSFKFESAWLLEEGCAMVVEAAWGQSRGMEFQHRIELCGQQLQRWGREHSSQFGNRIKIHRNRLAVLKEDRDPQE